jgi:hypothetical protein
VAVCHFHPDRAGVGVCVRCRKVICAACRTRVDGINHCHACLKVLGNRKEESSSRRDVWPLVSVLMLGVSGLALAAFFWLLQGSLAP